MNEYEIIDGKARSALSLEESETVLKILLSGNYAVWDDGSLYSIKQLVDHVNGLKLEIYGKEHAPPHFHVSGGGYDAIFAIEDCALLRGEIGGRERRLIEWWHERSKNMLVSIWNSTRPSMCPVGKI